LPILEHVIGVEQTDLKRRLTAVLLADVVGYSRLMSVDEEGTHRRLADHVKLLIEPAVAQHRGRPVRSMGDGMLVEFDSAVDAVRCAVEIQRGLNAREAAVELYPGPTDPRRHSCHPSRGIERIGRRAGIGLFEPVEQRWSA
jgi:class 3 adenylate cyclase